MRRPTARASLCSHSAQLTRRRPSALRFERRPSKSNSCPPRTLTLVSQRCVLPEPPRSCSGFSSLLIQVSTSPTNEYFRYGTPYIQIVEHTLSLAQEATPESKTSSTLEFTGKDKEKPLPCGSAAYILVKYTIVGETKGPLDLFYYVSKGRTMAGNPDETTISYHDNNDK